jgi:hypothetical protein
MLVRGRGVVCGTAPGRWKEYDVVEANNSYARLQPSHVTRLLSRRERKGNAALDDWMLR